MRQSRVMRWIGRVLRVVKWIGLGLSVLLLIGTIVLWARSLGRWEEWCHASCEPQPQWTGSDLEDKGVYRRRRIALIHGRVWLQWVTWAPERQIIACSWYDRPSVSADAVRQFFESETRPGERPWMDGTERAWRSAGMGLRHQRRAVNPDTGLPFVERIHLAIPLWMPAAVFGAWPGIFVLRRLRRRKRYAQGLCPACGYDLRATPDRCPECGREMKVQPRCRAAVDIHNPGT